MKILKFGGTSLARSDRLDKLAGIVAHARSRGSVVVVVSAVGGVTDQLVDALDRAVRGEPAVGLLRELRRRHLEDPSGRLDSAARKVLKDELEPRLKELDRRLQGIALLGEVPPGIRHRVLATGERLAVPRVVAWLKAAGVAAEGVDGTSLLRVLEAGAEAEVDAHQTRRRVHEGLSGLYRDRVPVVTGFIGADGGGRTVTLGRGASDLSATVLAAAMDAEAVEIWTDTDGVFTADPSRVPEAMPLRNLNYGETGTLARYGAKVLHPKTLAPVARHGIPVWIRSTFQPDLPGTRIGVLPAGVPAAGVPAAGVPAAEENPRGALAISRVPVTRFELSSAAGTAFRSRAWAAVERLGVEPFAIRAPADAFCLLLRTDEADPLERELKREMRNAPVAVRRTDGLTAIALVTARSETAASLLGELPRALVGLHVSPVDLYLDSREDSHAAVAVIDSEQADRAVLLLHDRLVVRAASTVAA